MTWLGSILLGLFGLALIAYTLLWSESRFYGGMAFVLGCVILGFAGLSNSAAAIGLHPFESDPFGWRKAKKSERKEPDGSDKSNMR